MKTLREQNKFKWTPYSFSKMNYYTQCPKKFKFQYIDKIKTIWKHSLPLDRGKMIHLIFEFDRDIQKIKKEKEFKEIMQRGLVTKEELKNCFKVYDSFKASPEGSKLLSKTKLFAELPLGLDEDLGITEYAARDVFLRGYIDDCRIIEDRDDVMILVDWKSGKEKSKEDQDWSQLLYYSLGLFSKTPVEKIVLCYAYVDHNKLNLKTVHRSEIEKYKKALYTRINKIENDVLFNKNETKLCEYCDFQSLCLNTIDISEDEIPF